MNDYYNDFGIIDFLPSGGQIVMGINRVYNTTAYGLKKGYNNAKLLKLRLDIHNKTKDIQFLENIIKECNNDPLLRLKQEKEKLQILENNKKEFEKEMLKLTTEKSPKKTKFPNQSKSPIKTKFPNQSKSPIKTKFPNQSKSPIKTKFPTQIKINSSPIQVKKMKSPKKTTRRSKRLQQKQ